MLHQFVAEPAAQEQSAHAVIADQTVNGAWKVAGLFFLDEEMTEPGGDRGRKRQQPPPALRCQRSTVTTAEDKPRCTTRVAGFACSRR